MSDNPIPVVQGHAPRSPIADLLDAVHRQHAAMQAALAPYKERLAPDFNVFDFINPSEMDLSRVLGWLLDPRASHGQGGCFLQAYLRTLGAPWDALGLDGVEVAYEASTDRIEAQYRRIDILIRSRTWALAIENKPWAADQKTQVDDYFSYLDELKVQHMVLVYLSGYGNLPSEVSIRNDDREKRRAAGQFRFSKYTELIPWLEVCKGVCRAARVSTFIEDFIQFTDKNFGGKPNMTEIDEVVRTVTSTADHVSSAMKIISSADAIRNKLLSDFVEQVRKGAEKEWVIENKLHEQSYPKLNIKFGPSRPCYLTFEFQKRTNGLCYGVLVVDCAVPAAQIKSALDAKIARGDKNQWWVWSRWASPQDPIVTVDANWGTNSAPWSMIVDGTLSQIFIQAAARFSSALSDIGL